MNTPNAFVDAGVASSRLSSRGKTPRPHGFTLVELLVVITLIAILLALLTPALDRAVYRAELTVCAANLRSIGTGTFLYAHDFKRAYPASAVARPGGQNAQSLNAAGANGFELRPVIEGHMQLKLFVDPLAGKIDLSLASNAKGTRTDGANTGGTVCWANYLVYFGWGYPGEEKMGRVGKGFSWAGDRFDILAADVDTRHTAPWFITTHPDDEGIETFKRWQDEDPQWLPAPIQRTTASWWQIGNSTRRGRVDHNYLHDDGSVTRFDMLSHNEPGMALIPDLADGSSATARQVQLPPTR